MPSVKRQPLFITPVEAAVLASCSVDTIRRRIASGKLTGYRFGPRTIRVDKNELLDLFRPIPTVRTVA